MEALHRELTADRLLQARDSNSQALNTADEDMSQHDSKEDTVRDLHANPLCYFI